MGAFNHCRHLVSLIMGDNVKRIERNAFYYCVRLRFVRLSKMLEFIGKCAFDSCRPLEVLFLPSTVKSIEGWPFCHCSSLRLVILPDDIDFNNIGEQIIYNSGILQIAETAGVECDQDDDGSIAGVSNRQVNEWLVHHMDEVPFHKLCYTSSIATKEINDYLHQNDNDAALAIDPHHGMTSLHMLTMNPHAPADAIAALFNSNMDAIFRADNQQKIPLEYARDYNVGGLVGMITSLCNYRNSSILVESDTDQENTSKRRRL